MLDLGGVAVRRPRHSLFLFSYQRPLSSMSLSPAFARILFAEDDDLVRQVAEETLRDAGYNVVSVADGEDALAALPRVQPNLIVSDVRMPRCNGFDFLCRVRNDREFAHTPFIILSAKAEIADQRMGMSLGADDYVVKPYHPEDLLKAINLRLARAAAVREALTQQHRFLAHTLPHELRNPLTGILAYADLITQTGKAGRTLTSAELADYGENLLRSGLRLLRTAENFSLWATLESQQENVRALGTIIRSARAITGEQISALCRGVETEYGRLGEAFVRIAPATVSVRPHGLDQVIRHLLDNAFKFSFPKSRVEVIGRANRHLYDLSIIDHGRGMSEAQLARLDGLRQCDWEQREHQGIGLGLASVRRFARLCGGTFSLMPNPGSPGLHAQLSLPFATPGNQPQA